MAFINIAEILITDYNLVPNEITWYNHRTIDDDNQVFKLASRQDHTNIKVKIDPTVLVEANT